MKPINPKKLKKGDIALTLITDDYSSEYEIIKIVNEIGRLRSIALTPLTVIKFNKVITIDKDEIIYKNTFHHPKNWLVNSGSLFCFKLTKKEIMEHIILENI